MIAKHLISTELLVAEGTILKMLLKKMVDP